MMRFLFAALALVIPTWGLQSSMDTMKQCDSAITQCCDRVAAPFCGQGNDTQYEQVCGCLADHRGQCLDYFEASGYARVIGGCCKFPVWPTACVSDSDETLWMLSFVIIFPCLVLWAICVCKRDFDKFDFRGRETPNVDPVEGAVLCPSCGHDIANLNFCDQCGALNLAQWDAKAAATHGWNDPANHVYPQRAPHTLPVGYAPRQDSSLPRGLVRAAAEGAQGGDRGLGAASAASMGVGATTVPAGAQMMGR